MHTHVYAYANAHVITYMYICISVCVHLYPWVCVDVYVCGCVVCVSIGVHTYIYILTNTHVHTRTETHIRVCVCPCVCVCWGHYEIQNESLFLTRTMSHLTLATPGQLLLVNACFLWEETRDTDFLRWELLDLAEKRCRTMRWIRNSQPICPKSMQTLRILPT